MAIEYKRLKSKDCREDIGNIVSDLCNGSITRSKAQERLRKMRGKLKHRNMNVKTIELNYKRIDATLVYIKQIGNKSKSRTVFRGSLQW